MRNAILAGIMLLPIGIAAVAYQGFAYISPQSEIGHGTFKVKADEGKAIPLPPLGGGLAVEEIKASWVPDREELPQMKIAAGFKVEKIYTVPSEQGSWISLAVDPEGRLLASAQSGLLYRITPRAGPAPPRVEPLRIFVKDELGKSVGEPIGSAQGLLWAFDSLYVVVNGKAGLGSGLYRVRSTRKDGPLDSVRFLASLPGGGEHGPHGIAVDPGGKFLYVTAGNDCGLPEWQACQVPLVWGGDQLLSPHTQELDWHSKNGVVPGGWICRTDPDGKKWEIFCSGFRNSYRLAFSPEGELFTSDGDNEWHMGLPWYRAPRICHVTGGGDFGWRNGNLKWSTYFPDGLSSVADLPKGGPSGLVMGTGAKFPAKYQRALFALDWAYGRIYVAHLKELGATYSASIEMFLSGRPLAMADAVVGKDGALYFVVGGRSLESGIFRITYIGPDSTEPVAAPTHETAEEARRLRHTLEELQAPNPRALDVAWPILGSADARLRAAARAAIEQQDTRHWKDRVFTETQPQRTLTAAIALARCGASSLEGKLVQKLDELDWGALSSEQRVELLRAYALTFIRMGKPDKETAARISARLNAFYPARASFVDRELSRLLAYLGSPEVIEKTLALLEHSPAQEDRMHFGWVLNAVKEDWPALQRERYLRWLGRADGFGGGREVRDLLSAWRTRFAALASGDGPPSIPVPYVVEEPVRKSVFTKEWTMAELLPAVKNNLQERNYERGRRVYSAATCVKCHYFNGAGTEIGPDLTHVGCRLNTKKILESLIEPSKVIGDPYSSQLLALHDGRKLFGRILCESNGKYQWAPDPLLPGDFMDIDMAGVVSVSKSAVSIMPEGLLTSCDRETILDLLAYLVSGGDRQDKVFQKGP